MPPHSARLPQNVWAVVPVKSLARAKSRLAGALSPEQRRALALALLEHTLAVLFTVETLSGILVVTPDAEVQALALAQGAACLLEQGPPGLNRALARGTASVRARGADAVLALPADLPHLSGESVRRLLALGAEPPVVVIAPDRREAGTNALLLAPSDVIPFSFGAGSLRRHEALAKVAGVPCHLLRHPHLAVDVDVPGDLDESQCVLC